jgi:protein SCO1/2
MMRWKIRGAAATAASVVLAVWMVAALGSVRASADTRWGAAYLPNVTLTTQDGVDVHFYDDLIKGKIVAVNLIYTTCKYACPLETARLAQVARVLGARMGRDIFFYSISIDPDVDTPAVLKAYKEKYQIGPGWTFLTGKKDDIELISKKLGLYSQPNPANPDGHTPMLVIGNEATGQWMRNSAVDNPKFLATTIGDWLDSWQTKPATPLASYAEAPTKLVLDPGQYVFKNHCAACHTIGQGDHLGPDLLGVATTRDREWLTRFIVNPEKVRATGDPVALALRAKYKQVVMPALDLGRADAAVLIDFIDKESRAIRASAPAAGAKASAAPAASVSVNVAPILEPYLRIQRALNVDTVAGVKGDARLIADQTATLGSKGTAMQAAAGEVQQASDFTTARAAFARLSDAVIQYARESGAGFGDEVKVAYCPMVQKYWLQKGDTIQNPFYGKQMSDCGRIATTAPTSTK